MHLWGWIAVHCPTCLYRLAKTSNHFYRVPMTPRNNAAHMKFHGIQGRISIEFYIMCSRIEPEDNTSLEVNKDLLTTTWSSVCLFQVSSNSQQVVVDAMNISRNLLNQRVIQRFPKGNQSRELYAGISWKDFPTGICFTSSSRCSRCKQKGVKITCDKDRKGVKITNRWHL